jgi:hypothetical protein
MPLTTAPIISISWISAALERLTSTPCGYHWAEPSAAEPTALAALSLIGAGQITAAQTHLKWLAVAQTPEGCIAPFPELNQSTWPTAQATFAAAAAARREFQRNFTTEAAEINRIGSNAASFNLSQASQWLLGAVGKTVENSPEFGHNGQLVGWPWVLGTHSWQEPTAWFVLALKAMGLTDHPRTREGIRLLVDRLLSRGGCNFGNTVVLGQKLRPQVEPTGVTLLALVGEQINDPRIELSLQYLSETISAETTPISLGYGLLGLTAHKRRPAAAEQWLETAYQRTAKRDAAPISLALLVLAAQGIECPLIKYAV